MPIERPIAGSTEIIPVFPIAVTSETPKMMANVFLGRPSCSSADLGMEGLLSRAVGMRKPQSAQGPRTPDIKH